MSIAFTDASISLGGNDISSDANQINWQFAAAPLTETAFGDTAVARIGGGLQDGSGTITLNQDFTNGALDDLVFAMLGTVVALVVRPTSAVIGVNNPQYTGNVHIDSYQPFGGSVDDTTAAQATINFSNAGAVARAEA